MTYEELKEILDAVETCSWVSNKTLGALRAAILQAKCEDLKVELKEWGIDADEMTRAFGIADEDSDKVQAKVVECKGFQTYYAVEVGDKVLRLSQSDYTRLLWDAGHGVEDQTCIAARQWFQKIVDKINE